MADEVLSRIRDAENRAQVLIASAKEEAAQMLQRAQDETSEVHRQLIELSRKELEATKRQTEINSVVSSIEYLRETEEMGRELRQQMLLNKHHAINAVIKTLTVL